MSCVFVLRILLWCVILFGSLTTFVYAHVSSDFSESDTFSEVVATFAMIFNVCISFARIRMLQLQHSSSKHNSSTKCCDFGTDECGFVIFAAVLLMMLTFCLSFALVGSENPWTWLKCLAYSSWFYLLYLVLFVGFATFRFETADQVHFECWLCCCCEFASEKNPIQNKNVNENAEATRPYYILRDKSNDINQDVLIL
jgi:hypothetical protein